MQIGCVGDEVVEASCDVISMDDVERMTVVARVDGRTYTELPMLSTLRDRHGFNDTYSFAGPRRNLARARRRRDA